MIESEKVFFNDVSELVCEFLMKLGAKGSPSHASQDLSIFDVDSLFESFKELQSGLLSSLESLQGTRNPWKDHRWKDPRSHFRNLLKRAPQPERADECLQQ